MAKNQELLELQEWLKQYGVERAIEDGHVVVSGNLYLSYNQLTSLPESFGNLKVGGDLHLSYNQLTSLPESFGNLKVGGDLIFGNLKVGGDLHLSYNQLTSLPESFGNLKVGGDLILYNNQLTSLPESFGNLKVGGNLYLSYNQLTSLPESFGNLKVGGNLYLSYNQLTSLPESFGNLKVGGNLILSYNKLTSLPTVPRMTGNVIEKDWCFIDGIVREIVSKKQSGSLTILRTPFDYIAGDGTSWAHGKTLKEAIADYRFKAFRENPETLKDLDLDEPRQIEEAVNIYRAVTGSCREGIRQWMHGKTIPNPISINQIFALTAEAYGGYQFKAFFAEVAE